MWAEHVWAQADVRENNNTILFIMSEFLFWTHYAHPLSAEPLGKIGPAEFEAFMSFKFHAWSELKYSASLWKQKYFCTSASVLWVNPQSSNFFQETWLLYNNFLSLDILGHCARSHFLVLYRPLSLTCTQLISLHVSSKGKYHFLRCSSINLNDCGTFKPPDCEISFSANLLPILCPRLIPTSA